MSNTHIIQCIKAYLIAHPGATAHQISIALGQNKQVVNQTLYQQRSMFQKLPDSGTPKWVCTTQVKPLTYIQVAENIGMLQHLGYKTGDTGLPKYKRRAILDRVMTRPLPRIRSAEYMACWGNPMSSERLGMIRRSLAVFAKTRDPKVFVTAVNEWILDLAYVEEKYRDLVD